jgi:hypothetical protein
VRGTLPGLPGASPERLTSSAVQAQRGHEALAAAGMLGPFRGTVVHAHWPPSLTYDACAHAWCHAHHRRARRCITTQSPQAWVNDLAALLVDITAAVAATPAPVRCLALPALLAFETREAALIQAGFAAHPVAVPTAEGAATQRGRPPPAPPVHVWIRLRDFQGQVWACMSDWRVPFDHHQGERDIRMVQVKQQVSGGAHARGCPAMRAHSRLSFHRSSAGTKCL